MALKLIILALALTGAAAVCSEGTCTLADVGMMVIFDRLREGDWLHLLVHHRPALDAYWTALQQRPSYQAGCADFVHPAVAEATVELAALKQADHWPPGIPR